MLLTESQIKTTKNDGYLKKKKKNLHSVTGRRKGLQYAVIAAAAAKSLQLCPTL